MKKNNRGFTLAELLIVVAIIAVLTAIAIPVFTTQLEKSREATDASNVRAYYAEIATALLSGDLDAAGSTTTVGNNITATCAAGASSVANVGGTFTVTMPYTPVQRTSDWQGTAPNVSGVTLSSWNVTAGTAGTLTYTFTLGADRDAYLSAVAFA